MSLSQQIQAWLTDGYYASGVALLRQAPGVPFQRLRFFEQYLAGHYVPATVERQLRDALQAVAGAMAETVEPPGETVEAPNEPPGETVETPETPGVKHDGRVRISGRVSGSYWGPFFSGMDEVPVEVWTLYRRAIGLHKRQSENHALLRQAAESGDKKRALELAKERMEDIEPSLDRIYDAARLWKEKGTMPAPEQRSTEAAEAVARLKREKYLRERRSRLNAWLHRGEHPRKRDGVSSWVTMTMEEAEGYRRELAEIEVEILNFENE